MFLSAAVVLLAASIAAAAQTAAQKEHLDDVSDVPNSSVPASIAATLKAGFTVGAGENRAETGKQYTSEERDHSAIYVHDGGKLTLNKPAITTTGATSSTVVSSYYGLNAAVLVSTGGKADIEGGSIVTTGKGSDGVFTGQKGSEAHLAVGSFAAAAGPLFYANNTTGEKIWRGLNFIRRTRCNEIYD
jgi:hypothetical protein